jgi:hypothetical protein
MTLFKQDSKDRDNPIFYKIGEKIIEIFLITLLIYLLKNNMLTVERLITYLTIIIYILIYLLIIFIINNSLNQY